MYDTVKRNAPKEAKMNKLAKPATLLLHVGYNPDTARGSTAVPLYQMARSNIIGHNEVNPITRSFCPGPRFPFDEIVQRLQIKVSQNKSVHGTDSAISAGIVTDPAWEIIWVLSPTLLPKQEPPLVHGRQKPGPGVKT